MHPAHGSVLVLAGPRRSGAAAARGGRRPDPGSKRWVHPYARGGAARPHRLNRFVALELTHRREYPHPRRRNASLYGVLLRPRGGGVTVAVARGRAPGGAQNVPAHDGCA